MTKDDVINAYFNWLYDLVCEDKFANDISYRRLLMFLHGKEFVCVMKKDRNRVDDGVYMRYRFAYNNNLNYNYVSECLDEPCSVLELIAALALRCESIMDDPQIGSRTCQWFWSMITNLGLGYMSDGRFDRREAERIVDIFLNREYEPNGKGGLFTIRNDTTDLRDVELWSQMCNYLNSVLLTERR